MGTMVNAALFDEAGFGMLNLVTDFNDELSDWNAYQLANPASRTLFIPAGTHDAYGPDLTGTLGRLSLYGPGTQTILGENESTTFVDHLLRPFSKQPYFGSTGVNENGPLPRIDTMLVGDDVATLKVLADVSKFSVGQWVQVLAYDMQSFGYPINNHFFEYRYITNINVFTGDITLDQGVRHDYKDTYPELNPGSVFGPDQCGPATLMPMNGTDVWNYHAHAKNLTINPTETSAIYSEGHTITWENCHFLSYGHIPSISHTVNYINCEFDSYLGFEFDKSVELVNFENCFCDDLITQQSSSIRRLTMTDCEVRSLDGTAVETELTNCQFTSKLRIGTQAYGGAYSLVIDNCTVGDIFDAHNKRFGLLEAASFVNVGGGVFQISYADANSTDTFIRLIPDPNLWYVFHHPSHARYGPAFQCTDVTLSGETLIYTTTLDGTEPQLAICTRMVLIAVPSLTVTGSENNLPTDFLGFLSYPAAAGRTNGEYFNSGSWPSTAEFFNEGPGEPRIRGLRGTPSQWLAGEIVSMTFSVTKPYTGTHSTLLVSIWGEFFNGIRCAEADLTTFNFWAPTFNLKSAGTRVITPSGVTGAGSGDFDLAVGTSVWWCGTGAIFNECRLEHDITGEDPSVYPEFELEVILDQGIP